MQCTPIANSSISVLAPKYWSLRVLYQLPSGPFCQNVIGGGVGWIQDRPVCSGVPLSPLASVSWEDGKEIRVYYLDRDYVVQEYGYSEGNGWYQGHIGQIKAKASPTSRLAAVQYIDDKGGLHLRVYYQEFGSAVIAELCHDCIWHVGELRLLKILSGTSLAAVAHHFANKMQIRIYYQGADLSLREHCHNGGRWFAGHVFADRVPARTPIGAIAGHAQLYVYWRNTKDEIVVSETNPGSWTPPKVIPGIGPGFQFAIAQMPGDEKCFRLFHQEYDGSLSEHCSDDGGETWFQGVELTKRFGRTAET